jgi:hypothetical protein
MTTSVLTTIAGEFNNPGTPKISPFPLKRPMKISYATDSEAGFGMWPSISQKKPMLKISNWHLFRAGFPVDAEVVVEYQPGIVTIKRKMV